MGDRTAEAALTRTGRRRWLEAKRTAALRTGSDAVDDAALPRPRGDGGDVRLATTEMKEVSALSGAFPELMERRTERWQRRRALVEHGVLRSATIWRGGGDCRARTSEGRKRRWFSGSGSSSPRQKTEKMAAEATISDELVRRPGGAIARVCEGET